MTANPILVTTLNGSDDFYAAYLDYLSANNGKMQDFGRGAGNATDHPPSFQDMDGVIDETAGCGRASSEWYPGDRARHLSGIRFMITARAPKPGDYLGNLLRTVDRGPSGKCYYWIPNWPRDEAGNRTRTEFFNLYRLVTLARPPARAAAVPGAGEAQPKPSAMVSATTVPGDLAPGVIAGLKKLLKQAATSPATQPAAAQVSP